MKSNNFIECHDVGIKFTAFMNVKKGKLVEYYEPHEHHEVIFIAYFWGMMYNGLVDGYGCYERIVYICIVYRFYDWKCLKLMIKCQS